MIDDSEICFFFGTKLDVTQILLNASIPYKDACVQNHIITDQAIQSKGLEFENLAR